MSTWLNRGASGGLAGARRQKEKSIKTDFNQPPHTQKFGHPLEGTSIIRLRRLSALMSNV